MTEAEWLNSGTPTELVECLRAQFHVNRTKAGRRKLRLFGCGCCRRVWSLFDSLPDAVALIDAVERFADGRLTAATVKRLEVRLESLQSLQIPASFSAAQISMFAAQLTASSNACIAASGASAYCTQAKADGAATAVWMHEESQAAALFRCIFGNPFRPVTLNPAWRTSDVVALAKGIYDDRAFDRMPILADALQDAGCTNDDVLAHCRSDGPHARGCWVVDLVLGKG